MSNAKETGHAKTVDGALEAIHICRTLGDRYNPSKAGIQMGNLVSLHGNAMNAMKEVSACNARYRDEVSKRQIIFNNFSILGTQIISLLKASDASPEKIRQAITWQRKMQGRRATPVPDKSLATTVKDEMPETETTEGASEKAVPVSISASQLSYTQKIMHFYNLIEILKTESSYAPHEPELKISGLTELYNIMESANRNVSISHENVTAARISRNNILYAENTGIVDVVNSIKNYIKGVYKSSSPEYKQISAVKVKSVKL